MTDNISAIKERTHYEIDRLRDEMVDMARRIHARPEVGHLEHEASGLLTGFLAKEGFIVNRSSAGMETAFMASYPEGNARPAVALLAEYDALPGLGHACGHNLIGVASAAAAAAVKRALPEISGRIVVAGCPAEEAGVDGAGGKARMVDEGCFAGMDAALIFHPMPCTTIGGETSAMIGIEFEFEGKAAHAAGNPWDGINALDGVLMTFNAINALRQHVRDSVRIHGVVTNGGDAPNIVPEYASARFFVRSDDRDSLEEVVRKVEDCARGAATATGAKLAIKRFCNLYDSMLSNSVIAGVLEKNLEELGLGVEGKKKGKGSTDFGNVTRFLPGCELGLRLGEGIIPHTREFAKAAGSDEGYEAMLTGAKVLAASAVDLLLSPELLKGAREEFDSAGQ